MAILAIAIIARGELLGPAAHPRAMVVRLSRLWRSSRFPRHVSQGLRNRRWQVEVELGQGARASIVTELGTAFEGAETVVERIARMVADQGSLAFLTGAVTPPKTCGRA